MNTLHKEVEKKFSVPLFLFTIASSLALISVIAWFTASWLPVRFGLKPVYWDIQLHSTAGRYLFVFFAVQVVNCFAEWFFHRYMLHAPLLRWFAYLFVQHDRRHHMLTNVFIPNTAGNRAWKSFYAIMTERQFEASYFPWFSMLAFTAVALPLIITVQLLLPAWPIVICSVISLAWSLSVYEIVHMIQHWPDSFWQSMIRRFGRAAEIAYSYHCEHHAHMHHSNENISGFFCGLPLADWFMGTLKMPSVPYFTGTAVAKQDEYKPVPRFAFIRKLDRMAEAARKRYNTMIEAARRSTEPLIEVT